MPAHNILDTLGRVIIRRRWKADLLFVETVTNVKANNNVFTNAAAHMWSPQQYWGEYSNVVITFAVTGVSVGGSITTLEFWMQLLDPASQTYCNVGSTVTTVGSSFTVSATPSAQPLIALVIPTNFGGVGRIGVSMANTSTSDGNLSMMAHYQS